MLAPSEAQYCHLQWTCEQVSKASCGGEIHQDAGCVALLHDDDDGTRVLFARRKVGSCRPADSPCSHDTKWHCCATRRLEMLEEEHPVFRDCRARAERGSDRNQGITRLVR